MPGAWCQFLIKPRQFKILKSNQVGWLAREKDRAARIEDFVATLKQLHDDLEWPKPSLELKLNRRGSEKSQQQESPSYSLQSLRIDLGAGDSGYTSLQANSYLDAYVPSEQSFASAAEQPPHNSNDPLFAYNPDLANLALQHMSLTKFNDLSRISEEGDTLPSATKGGCGAKAPLMRMRSTDYVMRRDGYTVANPAVASETEAKLTPIDTASVVSEQVSIWDDDSSATAALNQDTISMGTTADQSYNKAMETLAMQNSRQLCQKLEVKIRYLLQLFTEANCLDLSLLLSILLLDSASVSRITNSAIRSGSLAICRQLRNGLKDITRWSFQEW